MNIAFDAYMLAGNTSTGIPNYIKNILGELCRQDSKNLYFAYAKKQLNSVDAKNVTAKCGISGNRSPGSFENTLWLFSRGVGLMKRDKIDIFWGTRQMIPPYLPGIKKVLTVYDLVWHYFPETMGSYNRLVMGLLARQSIKSADHIITISEATARSLTEVLGVLPEKISVIPPAADTYLPLDKKASADYIAKKYLVSKKYILTVSTVEPRKNLITMLRAFAGLRGDNVQFLIAGASGWKNSAIYVEYGKLGFSENEVKFLGYIPGEDMNKLCSGAAAFVFPSIYEGFGIPPLEAMASGTPVIVSNSSSLPEVAGDAGILLDPFDEAGWRDTLVRVLFDTSLQQEMIKKGIEQARLFSWKDSARKTLKIFEQFV